MLRTLNFFAFMLARNFRPVRLPYKAILLVTWRCQARCLMCNIWKKDKKDEFSLDEWIIFFRRNPHFRWLTLSGGEPFLRHEVPQIISAALASCPDLYYINMPTNSLAPDLVQKTIESILLLGVPRFVLSISLDGPEDVHDKLRGVPGAWRRAIGLLNWAKKLEKEKKPAFSVVIEHTLLPESYGRFDEMIARVQQEVIGITVRDFMVTIGSVSQHYYGNSVGGALDERVRLDQSLENALLQVIAARQKNTSLQFVSLFQRYFLQMALKYIHTRKPPMHCRAARSSVFIDPCGIVYPCNSYTRPLGSLRQNDYSVEKLFAAADMQQMRADIDRFKCGGCWTPCEASLSYLENILNPSVLWRIIG